MVFEKIGIQYQHTFLDYNLLTAWGEHMAKCLSQVRATIIKTDAQSDTWANTSMHSRILENMAEKFKKQFHNIS